MLTSPTDPQALRRLLRRQQGLISLAQAESVGLSAATLSRGCGRVAGGWQRVLPRVYARFDHTLTERDKIRAAILYAGEGAVVTGGACLHWRRISHLPREIATIPVDVLIPHNRQVRDTDWVRIRRSTRPVQPVVVNHLATAPVARAAVDAALRLRSGGATLSLLNAVVNANKATVDQLGVELLLAPVRGSACLRRALEEMGHGTRSVAEALARNLFSKGGLPDPEVNAPLHIGSAVYVPDFRWGRFIVEIDSREHHLLRPGSYEATVARRAALQAAGYFVLPVTPTMLAKTPEQVLAAVWQGYREFSGA